MGDWGLVHTKHLAGFTLQVSAKVVDPNDPAWCLIRVTEASNPNIVLLEAFFPKLLPENLAQHWSYIPSEMLPAIEMMQTVLLVLPAIVKQRITLSQGLGLLPDHYHRILQFMVTRFYAICKYEHDYDYGVPCTVYDPEIFDPTIYPKPLYPEKFAQRPNLLSFSGGKESQISKLVLDTLGIEYDYFRILDRADAKLLGAQSAEDWVKQYPNYECYLGDVRYLGPLYYLSKLHQNFAQARTVQPLSVNPIAGTF